MKLRDITNSKCDVRKHMSIEVSDEARYELENWDYDVDDVLSQVCISVDGHKLDDEITPFNVEKYLELNKNQQIVLEWLKGTHQIGWHVLELFDTLLNRNYIGFDEKEYSKMDKIRTAILALSEAEMFQVLAAFAEWGLSIEKSD